MEMDMNLGTAMRRSYNELRRYSDCVDISTPLNYPRYR
jgi:hypothetical protein